MLYSEESDTFLVKNAHELFVDKLFVIFDTKKRYVVLKIKERRLKRQIT